MNQEQAKAWLPLVEAVAEGKELQMEKEHYQGNLPDFREWCDIDFDYLLHRFNRGEVRFDCVRIKPEPKKQCYRVALITNGKEFSTMTIDGSPKMVRFSEDQYFVRYLTDRIEYELPEGEE